MLPPTLRCTAFAGSNRIATGELRHVALKAKQVFDAHPERILRVFDDSNGQQLELPLELPAADFMRLVAQPVVREAGTAQAWRGGARDHIVAAPLGLVIGATGWGVGGIAQTGGRGAPGVCR